MDLDVEKEDLKELILENQRLLTENNEILRKMHRNALRHFWFNVVWIIFLIGLPILAFYKIAAPLAGSLPSSSTVESQLKDLQELQGFLEQQR